MVVKSLYLSLNYYTPLFFTQYSITALGNVVRHKHKLSILLFHFDDINLYDFPDAHSPRRVSLFYTV